MFTVFTVMRLYNENENNYAMFIIYRSILFVSMLLRACTVHMGNATEMHWDRDFVLCPEHCANKQWVWPSSVEKGIKYPVSNRIVDD